MPAEILAIEDKAVTERTEEQKKRVEAHYRSYKDADVERYRGWAERNALLVSSGSDSHWPNHPVNPIAHNARWVAPLLERLGYSVDPWEGPAWTPAPPTDTSQPAEAETTTANPGD